MDNSLVERALAVPRSSPSGPRGGFMDGEIEMAVAFFKTDLSLRQVSVALKERISSTNGKQNLPYPSTVMNRMAAVLRWAYANGRVKVELVEDE